MARGIHGHPKVTAGPAMPDPSTPCGRATPETALQAFRGCPARRVGGLRPSSTPLDTPCRTCLLCGTRREQGGTASEQCFDAGLDEVFKDGEVFKVDKVFRFVKVFKFVKVLVAVLVVLGTCKSPLKDAIVVKFQI
jgi:hypothetical protein